MDTELILITVASLAFWVIVLLAGLSFVALRRISRVLEAAVERGYGLPGGSDIEGLLRLIPGDMFGPPEKCYYRSVSDYPGLLYAEHGDRDEAVAMAMPVVEHHRSNGTMDQLDYVPDRGRVLCLQFDYRLAKVNDRDHS